jgi:hypothetical protein
MNLVYRYFELGLEGTPINTLKSILEGTNQVKVKIQTNGILTLTNGTILKCVKNYYAPPTGELKLKKISNQCFLVQSGLGITGVQNYNCSACHQRCIQKLKEGTLIRKI